MTALDRTEITYRYERWRALSTGIIEAAGTTFLLLIAVRGFDAGRTAKALVAGDTGPLHLADAIGTKLVAIFGPTDPARNGPYGTSSVVLRNPASTTSHTRRAAPDEGMLGIGSEAVVAAARELLAGTRKWEKP
jgi:ADP-heptose:LPS heptosyltransferase